MSIVRRIITFRPSFTLRIITGLIALLMMLSVCAVVGITDQTKLGERDGNFKARSIEAGAKVYSLQCARCHGPSGEGIEGSGPSLASETFAGKIEIADDVSGPQIKVNEKSKRLTQIGFAGTLKDYIKGVTAAGVPIKSSNAWDANHPTFGQKYGGNLRDDQIDDVANFIINWGLAPLADNKAVLAPAPGANEPPKPTAVPLTPQQEAGKAVYAGSAGCTGCHAIKGVGNQGGVGPNLTKIAHDAEEIIASADYKSKLKDQPAAANAADYIKQSILYPGAYLTPQCPTGPCPAGVMPITFSKTLKPEELDNLVAYLSSLK